MAHQAGMGRICLLVVENPQSMHPSVLEELRCLAAAEVDGVRVLKMLLLGQPSLEPGAGIAAHGGAGDGERAALLARPADAKTRRQPTSRIDCVPPERANPDALMPYTLMPHIHACSGGVPARINKLCAGALAWARPRARRS